MLEEFSEPMTTTASASPARALRAAWRLVVAKQRSLRLGIHRSGKRSPGRSTMPAHSSWLRVVWANSATRRRPPSTAPSPSRCVDVLHPLEQAHRVGCHRHGADRLLVARVARRRGRCTPCGPRTLSSWWTLVTSGQTASTTTRPRSRAASTTSGAEPWAESMSGAPAGTSSTSSTKTTPWARNWSTTCRLWTISW